MQRPAQGGPDDVGQRDPLPRLGAHPLEVGQRGGDVDLHPGVDPAVARRAPGGDGDLPAHRGAAAVHRGTVGGVGARRQPRDAGEHRAHDRAGAWVKAATGAARRGIRRWWRPCSIAVTTRRATCVGVEHGEQAGAQHPVEGGRGRGVAGDAGHHVGGDRAELDGEGADRPAAQVGPQPGGQVGQPGLGGAVGGQAREGGDAGHRRDVDQVAAPAREHAGQHLAAQLGGGEQVQGDHLLELVGGEVGEVGGELDGRVVDQQVDRAVAGLDPRDQGAQGVAVGEVAGQGAAADLAARRVEGVAPAGDERDVGTGRGQPGGEPGADVTGGPGEEDVGTGDAHLASVHDGGAGTGIPRPPAAAGVERCARPRAVGCATPPVPPCGRGGARS